MSVLVVGSSKGGSGKSTLVTNIVIARAKLGKKVLLIDADSQESSTVFTEIRTEQFGESGYTAINLKPPAIRSETPKLAQYYDDVVIDVGGRDNSPLRVALTVANTLLIPVQPRSVDIWALDQMVEILRIARGLNDNPLRALTVINMADPAGKENGEALAIIREIKDLEVLPTMIGRRKAFANAMGTGRGVTEFLPRDDKAISEFASLMYALYKEGI
jgi:chromosome partitioning protein